MKRCSFLAVFVALSSIIEVISTRRVVSSVLTNEARSDSSYRLNWVLQVRGRQGIAADQDCYYISGSKALYKYSRAGELLSSNEDPFSGYTIAANHMGDIDVYNGELFVGAEWFDDGVSKNIQIAIHDAETLKFKRSFNFDPASGQLEVAGITVDPERKHVWMCSWVGGESGRYLYSYELQTGRYVGKLELKPVPRNLQGINYYKDFLWLTADDGDADEGAPDRVYKVAVAGEEAGTVVLEKVVSEVRRTGEIEGLAWDHSTGELLIHNNRGQKIVRGMPVGPYPGYQAEVHEVYFYSPTSV